MHADHSRRARGFLSITETEALIEQGVQVLDPHSALITAHVTLAPGVVIHPTVILDADAGSRLTVERGSVLYPGCVLEARDRAEILIGAECELGPGGVIIRVGGPSTRLQVGEQVRLTGGCELTGSCELGRGSQILGAISARSVRLGAGRGGHRHPVADERGAVLKGSGIADQITLDQGQVINCRPSFADAPVERQSAYHPPAADRA